MLDVDVMVILLFLYNKLFEYVSQFFLSCEEEENTKFSTSIFSSSSPLTSQERERVSHGRCDGRGRRKKFDFFLPRTFALIIFHRRNVVGRFLFFFFFSQVLIFKSDLFSDRISSNMQLINR